MNINNVYQWSVSEKKMFVNKIRARMSNDINDVIQSNNLPEDIIDSIIASAYDEKSYTNYDEAVYKYN